MDMQRLISFLGHTSNSDELMDFLSEHGIKKTPKGDCVTRVRSADKKISLEFDLTESYLRDNPRQAVGSGWFTFSSVDIYPGAKADLPFGLSFDLSKKGSMPYLVTVLMIRKIKFRNTVKMAI